MIYVTKYNSPIGEILLASMDDKIIGLWFLGQKYFFNHIKEEIIEEETEVLRSAKKWLDDYFLGKKPSIKDIPLNPNGSSFQKRVWRILCDIPYGETITYKKIANKITEEIGMSMSAQAVGGAVGHNPISIIIPCHRVVGKNGTLTGYAGGLDKKEWLLNHEKNIRRCKWCNIKNPLYIKYHDTLWGKLNLEEDYLFSMFILEMFQAGLSWECVLNKSGAFLEAYDYFDIDKICLYDEAKINELLNNKNIIRNKRNIEASIHNAKIIRQIKKEEGSFRNYLKKFTNEKVIVEIGKTTNDLSDSISNDLRKRGMKFVGSTTIYAYLQAIGIIYSHDEECFLYHGNP